MCESPAIRVTLPPAMRDPDFRRFGLGYAASSMGSEFTQLAMAWQMYELTSSPLQVGLIALVRFIPQSSLLLVGGILADAVDRRRLLIRTQLGQFGVSVALALLTFAGAATPLALYAGAAALAVFAALDRPTRASVVPNLVPREHLASGIAFMNLSTKLGSVLGPSLAGLAILVAGPALCYAADAASWLALLVAVMGIRQTRPTPLPGTLSLRSVGAGIGFVRGHPVILTVFALDLGSQLLGTNKALLPVFARDVLAAGPTGLGLLIAAGSAGALLMGAALSVRPPTRHVGLLILASVAVYGTSQGLFALSRELWLSALWMAVSGAADALGVVLRGTISQLDTPDALRGRVASVGNLFTGTGPRLGQTQSGVTAQLFGAPTAALAGALATLAFVGVMTLITPLRRYDPARDEAAAEAARAVERAEAVLPRQREA